MDTQMERRRSSAGQDHHQFLKTAEVARLLHVSPKTIARWSLEKKLPHTITPGGHRRFPATQIRELADRLEGTSHIEAAG
jgi:excisionase family DNA binding protein